MHRSDFFRNTADEAWQEPRYVLRRDYLKRISMGPTTEFNDVEIAVAIVDLIKAELVACCNGKVHQLSDADLPALMRAAKDVCFRVGARFPDLPFHDFASFEAFWKGNGWTGSGSYSIRKNFIVDLFAEVDRDLLDAEFGDKSLELVQPITPWSCTGWILIDSQVLDLRSKFRRARDAHDHAAIGLLCVSILETLGEVVFNPAVHLRPGENAPSRGQTKNKFDRVIERALTGPENATLRRLARTLVELTQEVKHSQTTTRVEAGIAADSVVVFVNLMRRIVALEASGNMHDG
jgi:hypothetical protein